jgi:hypothetical protein
MLQKVPCLRDYGVAASKVCGYIQSGLRNRIQGTVCRGLVTWIDRCGILSSGGRRQRSPLRPLSMAQLGPVTASRSRHCQPLARFCNRHIRDAIFLSQLRHRSTPNSFVKLFSGNYDWEKCGRHKRRHPGVFHVPDASSQRHGVDAQIVVVVGGHSRRRRRSNLTGGTSCDSTINLPSATMSVQPSSLAVVPTTRSLRCLPRSVFATCLAGQSGGLLTGKYASIGSLDGACVDEQFTARPAPTYDPQPRNGLQVVPGCIEHPLHNFDAAEDLNEEFFGQDKRADTVHDNRFKIRLLLQHSGSVTSLSKPAAPRVERPSGSGRIRRHSRDGSDGLLQLR